MAFNLNENNLDMEANSKIKLGRLSASKDIYKDILLFTFLNPFSF